MERSQPAKNDSGQEHSEERVEQEYETSGQYTLHKPHVYSGLKLTRHDMSAMKYSTPVSKMLRNVGYRRSIGLVVLRAKITLRMRHKIKHCL